MLTSIADPSLWLLFSAALAITFAAIVQATTGIGFGLIAAPALLFVDPSLVPGTVILVGALVSLLAAIRELPRVNMRFLLVGLAGRLPGAIAAGFIAAMLSPAYFGIVFGMLILITLVLSVFGGTVRPTLPIVGLAGVLSGFMGTLTSAGAPPMALALQHVKGPEMRATMSAFLLFGAIISMLALAMFGRFGRTDMLHAIILVPFVILGFYLSKFIIYLPGTDRYLRWAVLGLCCCASVVLIVKSVIELLMA